jgi:tetratricopeptide (TPR) repeat protein
MKMYGEKSYFFFKGAKQLTFLYILPFVLFALGLRLIIVSPIPFLVLTPYALISILVGIPRMVAAGGLNKYRKGRYEKAQETVKNALRMLFCPEEVKLFYAHLLILKEQYTVAEEILGRIKADKLTYAEEAKRLANLAILLWKTENAEKGIEFITPQMSRGADEGICYAAGKMLNAAQHYSEARKYSEAASESYTSHKGIHNNLCYSYYHTGQLDMFKKKFREVYHDFGGAESDTLFRMALLREQEELIDDARKFLREALLMEPLSTDIHGKEEIRGHLERLEGCSVCG